MVRQHPEAYSPKADVRINAVRLRDQITSKARTVLLVLLAASGLVFIIACSNVANLVLARTIRREGELADSRRSWAPAPGALRRTLLAESLLLCGAGRRRRRAHRAAHGRHPGALRFALLASARSISRSIPACCGSAPCWPSSPPCCWPSFPACPPPERRADSGKASGSPRSPAAPPAACASSPSPRSPPRSCCWPAPPCCSRPCSRCKPRRPASIPATCSRSTSP